MKAKNLLIFAPFSRKGKQTSAAARLEMFDALTSFSTTTISFGEKAQERDISLGNYYPGANPKNFFRFFAVLQELKQRHAEEPYDAVWTTLPPIAASLYAVMIAKFLHLPLYVDVRDPGITSVAIAKPRSSLTYRIAAYLEGCIYRHASHIFVTTSALGRYLEKVFAITAPWTVISNATAHKSSTSPQLPDTNEPIEVFYAGSFASYQVIDQIIKQLLAHQEIGKMFRFHFVGYKPERDTKVREIIEKMEDTSWITVQGPVPRDEVYTLMQKAHVCLVPIWGGSDQALYEYAIPLKYYEALAENKPILLFGGTTAVNQALATDKVGVHCPVDGDLAAALQLLRENYADFARHATAATYLRSTEAERLARVIMSH